MAGTRKCKTLYALLIGLEFILTDMVRHLYLNIQRSDVINLIFYKETLKIMWRNKLERGNHGQGEDSKFHFGYVALRYL